MGRRSINTTKSGKYMNPTDQARKEARKKELKKNKKQRQMVRAAVLKGKDPAQILEEMEKIDEMEYNVFQPSPLNEKVLREKRKKLKETFDRVMRLYHNDDPELWADLKRKEVEYEKRRLKKQQYYESVKHAQTVQVDEIPLPQMNTPGTQFPPQTRIPVPNVLPVPPFIPGPPPSILKKPTEVLPKPEEKPVENKKKEPPGCPPGPPPDLLEMKELDSDAEDEEPKTKKSKSIRFSDEIKSKDSRKRSKEDDEHKDKTRKRPISPEPGDIVKPTSLQQRMLAISGQNIDEFMKEMENVHKKKEQDKDEDSPKQSSDEEEDDEEEESDDETDESEQSGKDDDDDADEEDEDEDEKEKPQAKKDPEPSIPLPPAPAPPPTHSITLPSGPPPPPIGLPPAMIFRPPPLRPSMPGLAIRMPPGPPPGRPGMPPGPPAGLPPRLGIRMPPGPPPGLPPARLMHHHNQKGQSNMSNNQVKDSKGVTTITAKPQIRNLSADVTRFVPSTLRVKREDKQRPKPKTFAQEFKQIESNKGATKDDAYMQFMREMQGLL